MDINVHLNKPETAFFELFRSYIRQCGNMQYRDYSGDNYLFETLQKLTAAYNNLSLLSQFKVKNIALQDISDFYRIYDITKAATVFDGIINISRG